jgi:hypothetical protein
MMETKIIVLKFELLSCSRVPLSAKSRKCLPAWAEGLSDLRLWAPGLQLYLKGRSGFIGQAVPGGYEDR